jgi:hypothetical protein
MLDATNAPEANTDSATPAETETETERQAAAQTEATDGGEGEDLQQADAETAKAADAELVEHEYAGKRYRVPKEIVPALMMHADYTRKTQEVAEERRRLEGERTSFNEWAAAQQRHAQDRTRLSLLDSQIAQYRSVDWDRLEQDDPGRAQSLLRQLNFLKEDRAKLAGEIEAKESKWRSDAQQEAARRLEEGHRSLTREIPGWGPDMARTLGTFATTLGYSQAEAEAVADPRAIKVLHLAYLGHQLLEKQKQATAPKPQAARPVSQIGTGRAPPSGGPRDDQSPEEWMRARNKQLRDRKRR